MTKANAVANLVANFESKKVATNTVKVVRMTFDRTGEKIIPSVTDFAISPKTEAFDPRIGTGFLPVVDNDLNVNWISFPKITNEIVVIDVSLVRDKTVAAMLVMGEYVVIGQSFFKQEEDGSLKCLYGDDSTTNVAPLNPRHFGGYGGQDFTSSSLKDCWGALYENSDEDRIRHMMEESTDGAFRIMEGQVMTEAEFVKFASRLGQHSTTQMDLGPCHSEAILFGYFDHKDGSDGDGFAFSKTGSPDHSRMGLVKGLLYPVGEEGIETLMEEYAKPEYIVRSKITPAIQADLEKRHATKNKSVVVLVDDEKLVGCIPDAFVDMNAEKFICDYRRTPHYWSLEIYGDKEGAGTIRMSGQLLTKFLFKDVNFKDVVLAKNDDVLKTAYSLEDKSLKTISDEVLIDENLVAENILGLAKDASKKFAFMMGGLLNSKAKENKKLYNEYKFEMPGYIKTMIPDISYVFGKKGLLQDQIVTDSYADGTLVDGWRYPCVNVGAIKTYPVVCKKHMCYLIDHSDLSQKAKKFFKSYVNNMPAGFMMTPSGGTFTERHDSSDFDTDAMHITEHTHETEQFTVVADHEQVKANNRHSYKVKLNVLARYAALTIENGNISIGSVTEMFHGFQRIYIKRNWKEMKDVCQKVFGNTGKRHKKYVPQLIAEQDENGNTVYRVDRKKAEGVFSQLGSIDLSDENMKLVLLDLMRGVDRYYQEEIIDAVKKFYRVTIPGSYGLNKYVSRHLKNKFTLSVEGKEVSLTMKDDGKFSMSDVFNNLGQTMAISHAKAVKAKLDELNEFVESFDEEIIDAAKMAWAKASEAQRAAIKPIAKMLFMASGQFAAADKSTDEKEEAASAEYHRMTSDIENMYRLVMFNKTPEERIGILIAFYLQAPDNYKGVLRFIGRIICRNEMLFFAARYGGKDNAYARVENVVMPATYSAEKMCFRAATKNKEVAKKIKKLHKKLIAGFDTNIVSFARNQFDGVSILLNGKDTEVSLDTNKSNMLATICSTHNGMLDNAVLQVTKDKNTGDVYTTLFFSLKYVAKNDDNVVEVETNEEPRWKEVAIKF